MTSSIFLLKNINTLLVSIESLDLYTMDSLIKASKLITITELFIFRKNNALKYHNHSKRQKLYYITLILYHIIQEATRQQIKQDIKHILKDLSRQKPPASNYSLSTKSYLERFIVNYRRNIEPHLVGHDKYHSEAWLVKISIINLFLLYELYEYNNVYKLFVYLKYHNKHSTIFK